MKVSASIELVWQIAAQEAIAGEFAEIEPEHFLAAMLKFAELPVAEFGKLAPGARVPEELASEVTRVGQELQSRGLDATRVRRELRARLGRGGSPYNGGQKHRSAACRAVFDAAGRLADDSGSEALAAEHLLAALLASPSAAMRAVLGNVLEPKAIERAETPLLEQYGQDLVRLAAEGRLPPFAQRKAEATNLIGLLGDPRRPSVWLVTDDEQAARAAVLTLVQEIASPEPPAGLQGRRIVDVTRIAQRAGKPTEGLEHLESILREAAGAPEVVLLVPPIEAPTSSNQGSPWAELLKKSVCGGAVQCVCRTTPSAYERWIKRDYDWKKVARVMWIEDRDAGEIPWEL